MPRALLALGSNLGDRPTQLRRAALALARLPQTQLLARSRWHETQPVGGPTDQNAFLNAAALLETDLPPADLLGELQRIEHQLGRASVERWAARAIDLDLLLYQRGRESLATNDSPLPTDAPIAKASRPLRSNHTEDASPLILPHPRLTYRRFVLEPAGEIAPWMLHPESGWTIDRLLEHLATGANAIVVAAAEPADGSRLIAAIARRFRLQVAASSSSNDRPLLLSWNEWQTRQRRSPAPRRPKLVLAPRCPAGVTLVQLRQTLGLPPRGPIAWLGVEAALTADAEAFAAIESVWPRLREHAAAG